MRWATWASTHCRSPPKLCRTSSHLSSSSSIIWSACTDPYNATNAFLLSAGMQEKHSLPSKTHSIPGGHAVADAKPTAMLNKNNMRAAVSCLCWDVSTENCHSAVQDSL